MAQIVLPEGVAYSMELEQQLEEIARLRDRGADLESFDRALKAIDPRLSLVRASQEATLPGLTPGYWHVQRRNDPPAIDSYLILTAPDGGFIEPHSGILEWLRASDLQRPGALDELQRKAFAAERARQSAAEASKDQRMTEFAERYSNKVNPSVSFSDVRWKNRAYGRAG